MDKTEFLKELSSLSREEIQKKLNERVKRIKMISPVVRLRETDLKHIKSVGGKYYDIRTSDNSN